LDVVNKCLNVLNAGRMSKILSRLCQPNPMVFSQAHHRLTIWSFFDATLYMAEALDAAPLQVEQTFKRPMVFHVCT
jgi:hypothetical protein